METLADLLLVLLVLIDLRLLGASRLGACIRVVAAQGVVLGLLTIVLHPGNISVHTWVLALGSMAIKGAIFPWLLFHALREAQVRREVEPYVGYVPSLLFGLAALGTSLWLASRLPLPRPPAQPLVVPVALSTILVGLFLIVSRKKALAQVLGYLVLENGIYAFGSALLLEEPMLVELGVLLDVFVAVFVMGIALFHIHRAFDDLDTGQLTSLKE